MLRMLLALAVINALAAADGADRFAWAQAALAATPQRGIALAVDASALPGDGLLHARQVVPAAPGPLVLRYPRWIPGTHAPSGPLANVAGLIARGGGRALDWQRDPRDAFAFTVTVPEGVDRVEIDLTYIANQPTANSQGVDVAAGAGSAMINLNCCLLVPAAADIHAWTCAVAVRPPAGWQAATQLPVRGRTGEALVYGAMTIGEVVDRPILLGRHLSSQVLTPGGEGRLRTLLDIAADDPVGAIDECWITALRRLPGEAEALFGGARTPTYRFLVTLGDPCGLEHADCSWCGLPADALDDLAACDVWARELLPHEFVHAWVGKHRRPVGMLQPDFERPLDNDGLWVYEGLTQYLGQVLAARSGLVTTEEFRENLVDIVDDLATTPGRSWRSIRDTCRSSWLLRDHSPNHGRLRRSQDYYLEGALFWLAADLEIRRASDGQRSLDDFCRVFFGPGATAPGFTEDEVIAALTALAPIDWRTRVRRWIDEVGDLDTAFLADTGWRVAAPAPLPEADFARFRPRHARALIGLVLNQGWVQEVVPGSPAAAAGLRAGDYVLSLDEHDVREDRLALARALAGSTATGAITALCHRDGAWEPRTIRYQGGLVVPRLERVPGAPDRLGAIAAPRTAAASIAPAAPVAP